MQAWKLVPDDTQIGSPRLGYVEEELRIMMVSIRLAASSNGLGKFTKQMKSLLLAAIQYPTRKPGLAGNALFRVLLLTEPKRS